MIHIYKTDEFVALLEKANSKGAVYKSSSVDDIIRKYTEKGRINEETITKLIDILRDVPYSQDYIELVNGLLEDKRVRKLFQHKLENGKPIIDTIENVNIVTDKVIPTQNEIDISKSLDFGLANKFDTINNVCKRGILKDTPIVVFNGKYIIDGHHRWSQMYCFNRKQDEHETTFKAINLVSKVVTDPMDILKMVQTTIGIDLAPDKEIPVETTDKNAMNILSNRCTREFMEKYCDKKITDGCVNGMKKYHKADGVVDRESTIDYIVRNCERMKQECKPIKGAPSRDIMPQTDQDDKILPSRKNDEPTIETAIDLS